MGSYKYLIIPILSLIICQILKFLIEGIINHKFDIYRLIDGSGGMPSTHSTFVVSLTTTVGLNYGFDHVLFAICTIFSLVILYDAMGVRYETGKQAEIINNIVVKMAYDYQTLKEKVGHKPVEVLVGTILGIVLGITLNMFIN